MKVLVISAHPDDELLGVGGTAAAHAAKGDDVRLVILCEGISMRYSPERHAEVHRQAREAAKILGVAEVSIGDLPDQKLDTLPLTDLVATIEKHVQDWRSEVVYTHFGGDINRDHQLIAEASLVATRPYAAPFVREVLMFETPSSTEWGAPQILAPFHPNVFVDVSSTLDRKIEAFLRYTKEVRPFPHPRSPEALRDRARYWGSLVNMAAAEPFALVRATR
jgi:LmbE family N-acetylglucosaminyl deacetylase